MACCACFLFVFIVVAAGAVEYEYVPTPMGYVLKHCVHEVPNEAHILALEDGSTRVVHPDGTSRTIPRCDTRNGTYPTMRSTAQVKGPPLPANYGASRIALRQQAVSDGCVRWMVAIHRNQHHRLGSSGCIDRLRCLHKRDVCPRRAAKTGAGRIWSRRPAMLPACLLRRRMHRTHLADLRVPGPLFLPRLAKHRLGE